MVEDENIFSINIITSYQYSITKCSLFLAIDIRLIVIRDLFYYMKFTSILHQLNESTKNSSICIILYYYIHCSF